MFLASSSSACWWVARPLRRFISSTRLGPGQLGSWAVGTDSLESHRLRWHPKYARDINIQWYWHSKDVPNWDVTRNSLIITDFGTALKVCVMSAVSATPLRPWVLHLVELSETLGTWHCSLALEDHPTNRKWLINLLRKSPFSRLSRFSMADKWYMHIYIYAWDIPVHKWIYINSIYSLYTMMTWCREATEKSKKLRGPSARRICRWTSPLTAPWVRCASRQSRASLAQAWRGDATNGWGRNMFHGGCVVNAMFFFPISGFSIDRYRHVGT